MWANEALGVPWWAWMLTAGLAGFGTAIGFFKGAIIDILKGIAEAKVTRARGDAEARVIFANAEAEAKRALATAEAEARRKEVEARSRTDDAANLRLQSVCDRLDVELKESKLHIGRLTAHVEAVSRQVAEREVEHLQCRAEMADLHGAYEALYGCCASLAEAAAKRGETVHLPRKVERRPGPPGRPEAEARQREQSTRLLHRTTEELGRRTDELLGPEEGR